MDPSPIDGELLSSWLSRYAWASAIGPSSLLLGFRGILGRHTADLDADVPPHFFERLERRTGIPATRFEQAQRFSPTVSSMWTGALRSPRFCPRCWAADAIPYLRWQWRGTLFRVCTEHRVWLNPCCPKCQSPLSVLGGRLRRPLWCCVTCRSDLRHERMDQASPQAVLAQALIEAITELPGEIGLEQAVASTARVLSALDADISALEVSPREQVPQPMNAPAEPTGSAVVWDTIRPRVNAICRDRLRALLLQRLHQRGFGEGTTGNTPSPRKPLLLLSPSNRLGAFVPCVRPAIGADVPALRQFCRNLLALLDAEPRLGKGPDHYELLQDLAAFRWRSILGAKQPLAVGMEGGRVVGVGTVWTGRLVEIFVEPMVEADFLPVLLEGCVRLAARRGVKRLEAEVHYSNYTDFERAGWSRTNSVPLWSFDIHTMTNLDH
ncbi:TniQ family protein [Azospirillum agricola]|uniref:TniQ family protein n=1 Tax=Azospirillum agricola TaxID=1720247 RepID=UPI0015C47239|nr:TniQ family protein [Azospirillum agricola]